MKTPQGRMPKDPTMQAMLVAVMDVLAKAALIALTFYVVAMTVFYLAGCGAC